MAAALEDENAAWAWIIHELEISFKNVPPNDPRERETVLETVEMLKKLRKNYFVWNLLRGL